MERTAVFASRRASLGGLVTNLPRMLAMLSEFPAEVPYEQFLIYNTRSDVVSMFRGISLLQHTAGSWLLIRIVRYARKLIGSYDRENSAVSLDERAPIICRSVCTPKLH